MLIHLVADYGHGDLAFAEVQQRLALHIPKAALVATPVPAFDTISAGFCVAQLALTDGPERVVYHNVAPRADVPDPRPGNQGERLVMARLVNGVTVMGANAGFTFSFLGDQASVMSEVLFSGAGSQFRSRDFFPELLACILADDRSVVGEPLARTAVPAIPDERIVYVDGYGNLKTSWYSAPVPSGHMVEITIGGSTVEATVTDGTFEVAIGQVAFAPGSSGWTSRSGANRWFYEVFLRGGSAADRFGRPRAGAHVEVRPANS